MAVNEVHIDASTITAFETLVNPRSYGYWVVGSRDVRGTEGNWPEPGSAFHHTSGFGPLATDDQTDMLELERPSSDSDTARIVLRARGWPAGTVKIIITMRPSKHGTRLVLEEHPLEGPATRLQSRLLDKITWLRNAIAVRRLRRLVEHREQSKQDPIDR